MSQMAAARSVDMAAAARLAVGEPALARFRDMVALTAACYAAVVAAHVQNRVMGVLHSQDMAVVARTLDMAAPATANMVVDNPVARRNSLWDAAVAEQGKDVACLVAVAV